MFKTVSDGGVLDELKVVISPCNRFRGGQVIIMGDSTEIINKFKHLNQSVVVSSDCREGHTSLLIIIIRYARIPVVVVHNNICSLICFPFLCQSNSSPFPIIPSI